MYFKDNVHEEQTYALLEMFQVKAITQNIEYGAFAYMVGATYKAKQIMKCIDDDKSINLDKFYKTIGVFSSSEQSMLRFALQCFNSSIDDIKLSDVMRSLDNMNVKAVKQVIDMRY